MIAVALLIISLLFMLAILLLPSSGSYRITLIGGLLGLIASGIAYVQFSENNFYSLSENLPWISSIGIRFNISIDGISMVLVLLTGILYPFIIATTNPSSSNIPL